MVETARPMPQKNRILITGSSGMLGADLCQELEKDYEVYGADLVHRTSYTCPPKPERRRRIVHRFIKGDITNRKSVANIVYRIKPDIVIHAAAWTDVDGCELNKKKAYKINSEGTKNVALACRTANAPLIYISTDFVFDGKKNRPYAEADRPNPISVYGGSKYKGEIYIKRILRRYYILRTSWLYGRNGRNFVDIIIDKAKKERALKVVNDQIGSPTYTKDLAKAIHAFLDRIFTKYEVRSTKYEFSQSMDPKPASDRSESGEHKFGSLQFF